VLEGAAARAAQRRISIALACALGGCGAPSPPVATRQPLGLTEPGVWAERAVEILRPPSRLDASLTWDAGHRQLVLFAGAGANNTWLNDLWIASSPVVPDFWESAASSGTPPPARAGQAAAFDAARGVLVFYGGYDGATGTWYDDTWEWGGNGSAWSQRCTGCAPGKRADASMAWDPASGHVLMFGGASSFFTSVGGTWRWDGTSWTQLTPAASPSARNTASIATDVVHSRVLLFGGAFVNGLSGTTYGDTWQWDGANWTQLCTSGACVATAPPKRSGAGMAFDPLRLRFVLFGGILNDGSPDGSTWEWDGSAWSLTATVGPPARTQAAMAWYPTDKRVLLFGGGLTFFGNDDTWEYHAHGGACGSTADCDGLACVDGVCCEQATCATCQSCNGLAGAGLCTPVTNADDPDTCAGASTCDASGVCKLQIGQSCAAAGDCASTFCVGGTCCNRACDHSCEICTPTGAVGTCVTAPAGTAAAACGAFLCNGTSVDCPTACNRDTLCASGSWCDPTNGTCSTLKPGAQPCSTDDQCQTKHCVDGVCCDSACSGRCQYCGSGTCVVPVGQDPHGDCAGDPSCGGTCQADGSCLFPGAETACDVCKVCNQSGRCNQPPRSGDDARCGAIGCDALSTECRTFSDVARRCVDVGLCAQPNDPTACTASTNAPDGTPCSGGACQQGECQPAPPDAGKPTGKGGGCAVGGRGGDGGAWMTLLACLLAARRRRRPFFRT
jgi:hypothetical protein